MLNLLNSTNQTLFTEYKNLVSLSRYLILKNIKKWSLSVTGWQKTEIWTNANNFDQKHPIYLKFGTDMGKIKIKRFSDHFLKNLKIIKMVVIFPPKWLFLREKWPLCWKISEISKNGWTISIILIFPYLVQISCQLHAFDQSYSH